MTLSSVSQPERYNAFSVTRPIGVALAGFLIVVALRSLDLFVLNLDQLPDPMIGSRVLGFLLVLGYLWALGKPISAIGLHARNFGPAVLIGLLSLLLLYVVLYGIQFYRLSSAGQTPRLVFAAIDQETGALAGSFFTLFFLVGQFFNAFMEEAIFRGVILPHFMLRFRFWQANALHALLFGLAHLVFPLSDWVSGRTPAGEATAQAAALLLFTTIGGLVFGYLYYRTGSLWTAVLAHLLDNCMGLFFHIQTTSRLNAETDILLFASIGFMALTLLARIVAKRYNLPTLTAWKSSQR